MRTLFYTLFATVYLAKSLNAQSIIFYYSSLPCMLAAHENLRMRKLNFAYLFLTNTKNCSHAMLEIETFCRSREFAFRPNRKVDFLYFSKIKY